ncbi:MAG: sel1 repeat family protein [Gammaproteobacteria bacterium]|nr:sel1 repeat family protein [Gammaproteobacteria bacterium]
MNKYVIKLLTALLCSVLFLPVWANYDEGLAAAQKDDYKTAFSNWEKLAKNGDPNVQATVAVLYHAGQGVKQNYQKAFYWYKKAAQQGHAAAQVNLGVMYAKGTGTKQDMIESYAWYSLAAKTNKDKRIGNRLWGLDTTTAQLNPKQLKQAQKLSQHYIKKYKPQTAAKK